jgi:hypothetical protein
MNFSPRANMPLDTHSHAGRFSYFSSSAGNSDLRSKKTTSAFAPDERFAIRCYAPPLQE